MAKRLLAALLLIFVLALIAQGPSPATAESGIQGNVDCDAQIDSIDALHVLRHSVGLSTTAECIAESGDTNCDTKISSIDALRLLRHAVGLVNSVPAGCTAIGQPLGAPKSSVELIDQALADGEITQEQALLYTTFAVFGDSRLPAEFAADEATPTNDTMILQRLSAAWDSLSPETQEAAEPFLLPPSVPGSWLELPTVQSVSGASRLSALGASETWQTFSSVEGKVKVWAQDAYAGDAQKAAEIATAMETIFPSLVALMGREPISDAGLPNNGGDGALDIYLVHFGAAGEVITYADSCEMGPAYMLLDSQEELGSATAPGMIPTAAHELFHVLQSAFQTKACWYPEYRWAYEGFAEWATDYVYPDAQSEQSLAHLMLFNPEVALDAPEGLHAYGTYLLPYYLSRKAGEPGLARDIWEAFETDANSVHAVGTAIAGLGGWDAVWPEVALYNWNGPPVDDYKTIDDLRIGAEPVGGPLYLESFELVLSGTLNHLSAQYYHLQFPDEGGFARFRRNGLGALPHLRVQALPKIDGVWRDPEDWTDVEERTFCRDMAGQHLEELVIIIANSDGETEQDVDPGLAAPIIAHGSSECGAYVGTATAEIDDIGRIFETEVTGMRWELKPGVDQTGRYRIYNLVDSAPVIWTVSGVDDNGCTVSGEMHLEGADGTIGGNRIYGSLEIDTSENDYYMAVFGAYVGTTYTITCPGTLPGELPFPSYSIVHVQPGRHPILAGGVLQDEYTESNTYTESHWTWRFDPAP